MARWVELVGRSVGTTIDAETAMADWTPSHTGRIKALGVLCGGIAATTLIENGYIKISWSGFGGVDCMAPFDGGGVFTAPHGVRGVQWTEGLDLPVQQVPVKVYYYHNVTPTTPELTVFALIEG